MVHLLEPINLETNTTKTTITSSVSFQHLFNFRYCWSNTFNFSLAVRVGVYLLENKTDSYPFSCALFRCCHGIYPVQVSHININLFLLQLLPGNISLALAIYYASPRVNSISYTLKSINSTFYLFISQLFNRPHPILI